MSADRLVGIADVALVLDHVVEDAPARRIMWHAAKVAKTAPVAHEGLLHHQRTDPRAVLRNCIQIPMEYPF